ncbi:helix-turn-helix domain-containing protein [Roseibium sp.]|uniref:helix-turn-helix domain-containing protein n=1 Tax=Roseibium sp. TaxID=1936156 RepID=UPI003D0C1F16
MPLAIEFALRGGTSAICLLLGVLWLLRDNSLTARLGAIFVLITACYSLASSPSSHALFGPGQLALGVIASFGPVAFWLFARALFDDNFRLKLKDAIPAFLIAACLVIKIPLKDGLIHNTATLVHAGTIYFTLFHVVYLAIRDWQGDLVSKRRAFRVAITTLVPVISLVTTTVEISQIWLPLPRVLVDLQVLILGSMAFGFALWGLTANISLFATSSRRSDHVSTLPSSSEDALQSPADRIELEQLNRHMEDGGFREENLTVGRLGERLGIPEHRLRRIINKGLGYRNFSAFLNSYRLTQAAQILNSPNHARDQILQIALDLGYGSVGPFNRAFKAKFGVTPTDYRAAGLAVSEKSMQISKKMN